MGYTSNLTTGQYQEILPFLPEKKLTRPRKWTNHQILNGIMYVLVTGCQWRNLPIDLPPWKTVYSYFRLWSQTGIIDQILKKYSVKISPVYREVAKTHLFNN
jgi:transposase